MDDCISPSALAAARTSATPPLVIDVRRTRAYLDAPDVIAGALRRDPTQVSTWADALPTDAAVVVYCVHGHAVSQDAARALRERGFDARFLDHGIEGWRASGGAFQIKPVDAPTRWVTRERPKIDRIACPWLITRFVDAEAEFLYVPTADVSTVAAARSAIPYDTQGAEFGHHGDQCSFDAFVDRYGLGADPALRRLATVVRGADTGRLDLAPESAGLLALSTGLSRLHDDDHDMLRAAMKMYDALYRAWQEDQPAHGTWHLDALRTQESRTARKSPT